MAHAFDVPTLTGSSQGQFKVKVQDLWGSAVKVDQALHRVSMALRTCRLERFPQLSGSWHPWPALIQEEVENGQVPSCCGTGNAWKRQELNIGGWDSMHVHLAVAIYCKECEHHLRAASRAGCTEPIFKVGMRINTIWTVKRQQ